MAVCSVLFFVLAIVLGVICSGTEQKRQSEKVDIGTRRITEWTRECSGKKDENGNYTITYTLTVPQLRTSAETMMFYSYHSNVYVYVDGKSVYSSYLDKGDIDYSIVFPSCWNRFALTEEYEGRKMEIVMETPYTSTVDYQPDITVGDEMRMILEEIVSNFPSISISIVILACGFCMWAYSMIGRHRSTNSYSMHYLGLFSMLIGLWFILDLPAGQFLMGDSIFLQYFVYLLFAVLAVPFALFESQIIDRKFRPVLNGLIALIMAAAILCVGLQILGVADMKQSLTIVHIALLLFIVVFIILIVLNFKIKQDGVKEKLNRINLIFAVITAVAVGIDIVIYYLSIKEEYYYFFTKLSLLIYIITLAYYTLQETEELLQKGKDAEKFEVMAYHDELTSVYNRMAYQEYVSTAEMSEKKYIVVMFDLNNLKQCNDTWGHQLGDLYIKMSAEFIQQTFSELGNCYRIGGDEFCVVSEGRGSHEIREAVQKLEEKVKEGNRKYPKLNMGIAVGYAAFDEEIDQNLEDTRNRADNQMYQNKWEKKQ